MGLVVASIAEVIYLLKGIEMNFSNDKHSKAARLQQFMLVLSLHFLVLFVLLNGASPAVPTRVDPIPLLFESPKPKPFIEVDPLPKRELPLPDTIFPLPPIENKEAPTEAPHLPVIESGTDAGKQTGISGTVLKEEGGNGDRPIHTPLHTPAVVDARACEKPAYPLSAIRLGEAGVVSLAMKIGTDGKVIDAIVEKSSGSKVLDKAARLGLSLCKFVPAKTDGVAEVAWMKIQYVWTLDE
jgi:periplasmic protein TonB